MGTVMRIIIVVVCAIALYYLVVTLARSVSARSERGALDRPVAQLAAAKPGGWAPAIRGGAGS